MEKEGFMEEAWEFLTWGRAFGGAEDKSQRREHGKFGKPVFKISEFFLSRSF